jgi:hypothetical protein
MQCQAGAGTLSLASKLVIVESKGTRAEDSGHPQGMPLLKLFFVLPHTMISKIVNPFINATLNVWNYV